MTDKTKNNPQSDLSEDGSPFGRNTENVSPEDVELVTDEEYGPPTGETGDGVDANAVKKLRAKLKESQVKSQEYMTGWQRARADYVNAKRQNEEDRAEFLKYSERKLMLELLALADSFDLALVGPPPNADQWSEGVGRIRSQLEKILTGHGVKAMEVQTDKKFDPNIHEALMSEPVAEEERDDTVIQELVKGYLIHDQVLRPAKVKVGEYKQNI